MPLTTNKESLIAEADKCVLCGMCLPHCPTYSIAQNENESPRGRLVLGKAYLSGLVSETKELRAHIDHCLLCRSCESCCPSGVQFGMFMDGLRSHLPRTTSSKYDFADILTDQQRRRALNKKLWLGQQSGVLSLGKTLLGKMDKRLLNSLPTIQRFQTLESHYPASDSEQARVMLFTGCNSELLGNALVFSTIKLLNQLGVSVEIPPGQECCGGLSRHHGDAHTANKLESQNISAFASDENIPIVTLASGCGASLLDYEVLPDKGDALSSFTSRVTDINSFLAKHLTTTKPSFRPLNKKISLHTPCSMKNVMHQEQAIPTLLKMIPGLEVAHLSGQHGCCGAAGTYMFEQAEYADTLREPIIANLAKQMPDILVTTNIGCAMHIQAGLKPAGLKLEIRHPVELLLRSVRSEE